MSTNTAKIIRDIPRAIFQYAFSIFLFGFLWFVIVELFAIPKYILPSPKEVIETLSQDTAFLIPASTYTIVNASIGALAGTTLGIIIAIWLAASMRSRWIVEPYLVLFQSFPKESLFPVFIIWLGVGSGPKLMNSFLLSFFPVTVLILNALINVDKSYIMLTRSLAASTLDEFLYCRLPYVIPQIAAAFKIALPLALVGAVLGEYMGGNEGLGYIINASGAHFRVDRIFAAIFILGMFGIGYLGLIQAAERLLLKRFYF